MKYCFSIIILFLLSLSASAEDFKLTLETKVTKANINDTFQVKLISNSEIVKIEKGFLEITGAKLKSLEKIDDKNFVITLKIDPDTSKVTLNILPEKIENKDKIRNKEKSNKISVAVIVPSYFTSVLGSINNNKKKESENNPNQLSLTSSLMGGLGPLLGLLKGGNFGGGQTTPQPQQQSGDQSVQTTQQGNAQPAADTTTTTTGQKDAATEQDKKTGDSNAAATTQSGDKNSAEQDKAAAQKAVTSGTTQADPNKIVFVDCNLGDMKNPSADNQLQFFEVTSVKNIYNENVKNKRSGVVDSVALGFTSSDVPAARCFDPRNFYAIVGTDRSKNTKSVIYIQNFSSGNEIKSGMCTLIPKGSLVSFSNLVGYNNISCSNNFLKGYGSRNVTTRFLETAKDNGVGKMYFLRNNVTVEVR